MKHSKMRILALIMVIVALSSINAFASAAEKEEANRLLGPKPTMIVMNGQATCKVMFRFPGKYIDATLELWEGSTPIASWSDNGTGSLTISGTATVYSGHTYTLTVTGTIDGVSFTPSSITKTI